MIASYREPSRCESERQAARVTGLGPTALARILPYLALPPVAIAVFALHQWLKQRQGRAYAGRAHSSVRA